MRTAFIRTAICAVVCALAGCNYNHIQGALEFDITGIPESAVSVSVVVTDSSTALTERDPSFGNGVYASAPLVVTFPTIASGAYTVQVEADDIDHTPVAVANVSGSFTPVTAGEALPVLGITLSATGLQGTYGTPCILSGTGTNTCSGTLICKQYTATDQGICTHACQGTTTVCEQIPTGVSCGAFEGVAVNTYCQWECSADGGSCPPNTVCGAAVAASGGKRYCQGSL